MPANWESMSGESDLDLGVTIRSFAAGQRLFGRYTLVRALGRGGMGVVWLARDGDLERDVALKFLPEMVAADPVAIDDLKHETRRSLELTHPNIVRVHDFVQEEGVAAISMEFVKGRTLGELRLERPARAFQVAELGPWVQQICEALHYAHVHAKVVHRDLKPANIMVDERNRIKLTDFGISATVSDTVTRVSRVASSGGTAAYASPQQLMGEAPSPSDDIYALGATIFELLTSRPPFFTGNLLLQVQNRVPPSMAERRRELEVAGAEIPRRWEELVAAALAKSPQERPPTIESFAHRLDLAGAFPAASRADGAREDPSLTSAATVVSFGPPPLPGAAPVVPTHGGTVSPGASPTDAIASPSSAVPISSGTARLAPGERAPAAAPTGIPAARRSSRGRWVFLLLLLAAAGVGLWLADVPNWLLAARSVKEGQRATVVADYAAAVEAFRDALLKRPGDAAIRTSLEAAQRQWLDQLRNSIAGAEPSEALRKLRAAAAGAGSRLVEPQAGELRQLLADSEGNLRDEAEREVRGAIEAALRKADDGDVAAALAQLESLESRGVLQGEIENARQNAPGRAVRANVTRLADAIASNNAGALQNVFARSTGSPAAETAVAAARVLAAKEPATFLEGIKTGGVQLGAESFDTLPSDLTLVEVSRERFADAKATKSFLGRGYAEAAQAFLDNGLYGFALYAARLARAEGRAVDPALERAARQKLTYEFDYDLHLAGTQQGGSGADSSVPVAEPRKALRDVLKEKVGAWMTIVELAPLSAGSALVLRTRMSGLASEDNATEATDSVRYQTGTRNEPNPDYERIAAELAEARRQADDFERQLARVERGGDSRTEQVLRGIAEFGLRMNASQAREKADALAKQLQNTPRQTNVPVYADEPYRRITHRITYRATLDATPTFRERDLASGVTWSAETKHESTEVIGNASRGVPVKRPEYPSASSVASLLAEGMAGRIRKEPDALIRALMAATFSRLDVSLRESSATPAAVADRRWGLLALWQESGMAVPQTAELEQAVREQLGLPRTAVDPGGTGGRAKAG